MPDENENNIAISELDEALDLTDSAQFPYTQNNGGTLTTFKARLTQIAAKIIEGLSFAGINLPTSAGDKTVENSINFLLDSVGGNPNENIATEYDPTDTYAKGDYVIYENVLYICTDSDGTTGTFDPTAWSQTELAEHTAQNAANVGDLSTLTTTDKSSIVGAVNEVDGKTKPQIISTTNNIYIYEVGKIVCVGFYNATVDNVISALSGYTTNNNVARFVVWNATTARANLVSIGTSILVIDTNPWGSITGNDALHGGFTFVKV